MTPAHPVEFPVDRACSDDIPQVDRLARACGTYAGAIIDVDIVPRPDSPFRWRAAARRLPGLGIAAMQCSAVHIARRAAPDADDIIVNAVVEGALRVRTRGREIVLRPGEAVVTRAREAMSSDCDPQSRLIDLRVPLHLLAPAVGELDAVLGTAIAAADPVAMLRKYSDALLAADGLEQPEALGLAVAHVREIVDLILGLARTAARITRARGPGAARLAAIKADIVAHASSRELTIGLVAARQHVTARYVRKLFESEGRTFSGFVLDQRLMRARRMLTDPRRDDETISAIAYACGFGDLSYFNRVFRRRNGATPSAVRAAARRDAEGGERADANDAMRSVCQAG
jgi:AraC-like DNA-binding protein